MSEFSDAEAAAYFARVQKRYDEDIGRTREGDGDVENPSEAAGARMMKKFTEDQAIDLLEQIQFIPYTEARHQLSDDELVSAILKQLGWARLSKEYTDRFNSWWYA